MAGTPSSSAANASVDHVETQPIDVTTLPAPAETPPKHVISPPATADEKRSRYQVKPEPRAKATEDKSSKDAKPEEMVEKSNKPVITKKTKKTQKADDVVGLEDSFTESDQEAGVTSGLMYCILFCYRVNIYIST